MKRILIILAALALSLTAAAQTIRLDVKGESLQSALKAISAQTDYKFAFNSRSIDTSVNITVKVESDSIDEVMAAVLKGTGIGYSVLDIIKAFNKACGRELPYVIDPRRPGDIAQCYSDPSKAAELLHWKAERGIDEMCRDAWNWQSKNPEGYV
jgi:GDP-D-mannose dehydratase